MNHYCTYFDSRYLTAGLALRASLARHDPGMTLWVLALDDRAADALGRLALPDVRVVRAAELEAADPELARSRRERSFLEHLFTFSPCLPRHLLRSQPALPAITYVDADLWFLHAAAPMHAEWARASVYITPHDQPAYLREREQRFGRFNVGVVGFRNDENGRACLDWWRERCLEWCKDLPEPGRYADQKYLDEWPARFPGVAIAAHPGVNVAPWNWASRRLRVLGEELRAGEAPLIVFHFAQLRRLGPDTIDTNQAEYGVMPFALRGPLYGRYVEALDAAARELTAAGIAISTDRPRSRAGGWKRRVRDAFFGPVWHRVGSAWFSSGFGLGSRSGAWLAAWRRWRGRPV